MKSWKLPLHTPGFSSHLQLQRCGGGSKYPWNLRTCSSVVFSDAYSSSKVLVLDACDRRFKGDECLAWQMQPGQILIPASFHQTWMSELTVAVLLLQGGGPNSGEETQRITAVGKIVPCKCTKLGPLGLQMVQKPRSVLPVKDQKLFKRW